MDQSMDKPFIFTELKSKPVALKSPTQAPRGVPILPQKAPNSPKLLIQRLPTKSDSKRSLLLARNGPH